MSGALIVTAELASVEFAFFDGLRRAHFPPDRNVVPAHLTLFHQLPPMIADELAGRLAAAVRTPRPRAMLARIIDLGGGTAFGVDCEGLDAIRDDLAAAFRGMLTAQDSGGWCPHVTVQNKVPPKIARALQDQLRIGFAPRPLAIHGLASWRYLGGPWEPLGSYAFRG